MVGSGLVLPGAAQAGEFCNANWVRIFDGNDFSGIIGERGSNGGVVNIPGTFNDKMDSWKNLTDLDAAWYYNANSRGKCNETDSHSQDSDINVFDSDELSSWRTDEGC